MAYSQCLLLAESWTSSKMQYSACELELLCIVRTLAQWKHYCQGPHHVVIQIDHVLLRHLPNQASANAYVLKWINIMQRCNLEIRHILGKSNPTNTLSKQGKKDPLGRKTVVHDANVDLVNELRVPSDTDGGATQEALMKLFNAQVQDQIESVAVEGQVSGAKRSDSDTDQVLKASILAQALKASDSVSDQISLDQPESESKTSRLVQFKPDVIVWSSSQSSSHCTLAVSRNNINIESHLNEKINSLLQHQILYKKILEGMECMGKNELVWGQENSKLQKKVIDDSFHWTARWSAILASGCYKWPRREVSPSSWASHCTIFGAPGSSEDDW